MIEVGKLVYDNMFCKSHIFEEVAIHSQDAKTYLHSGRSS